MTTVWNHDDRSTRITISNKDSTRVNLVAENNSGNNWGSVRATLGVTEGKWYFEIVAEDFKRSGPRGTVGVATSSAALDNFSGSSDQGWGFYWSGTSTARKYHNNSYSSLGTVPDNDVVQVALDMDAGKIWFGQNGTWLGSGDPETGANPAYSNVSGTVYPICSIYALSCWIRASFRAEDYGSNAWEYEPPDGYSAWASASNDVVHTPDGLAIPLALGSITPLVSIPAAGLAIPLALGSASERLPKSLYWFGGLLDYHDEINPVIVRGYDEIGNAIYAIRAYPGQALPDLDDVIDVVQSRLGAILHYTEAGRAFMERWCLQPGFNFDGQPVWLLPLNWATLPPVQRVFRMAAAPDGRLYCAMDPVNGRYTFPNVTRRKLQAARQRMINAGASPYHAFYEFLPDGSSVYDDCVVGVDTARREFSQTHLPYQHFIRVFRPAGDEITFNPPLHTRPVYAVTVDPTGDVYLAGEPDGDPRVFLKRYTPDGVLVWGASGADFSAPPRYTPDQWVWGNYVPEKWTLTYFVVASIVVLETVVYVTGFQRIGTTSNMGWIRGYDRATGTLLWERYCNNHCITPAATDGTYVYTTFYRQNTPFLPRHYRSVRGAGYVDIPFHTDERAVETVAWNAQGEVVSSVARAVDSNGYVIGGTPGALICTRQTLWLMVGPAADALAAVYHTPDLTVATDSLSRLDYLSASSTSGSLYGFMSSWANWMPDQAHRRYFGTLRTQRIDVIGEHNGEPVVTYPGGMTVTGHFAAYEANGAQRWIAPTARAYPSAIGSSLTMEQYIQPEHWLLRARLQTVGWAVNALALTVEPLLPALRVWVSGGQPEWIGDRYTDSPGLAMAWMPGVPDWRREYVGTVSTEVYRLQVAGIFLPLTTISIRKTLTTTAVQAVVGIMGLDVLALIESARGSPMRLLSGVRFMDGSEQLELHTTVTLTRVRSDRGVRRFSVTLDGSDPLTEPQFSRIRVLSGINYYRYTDGQWQVRCRPDTYLVPGMTATLRDGQSMTVSEVVWSIAPDAASMEVMGV
jgi:hypothetical protein